VYCLTVSEGAITSLAQITDASQCPTGPGVLLLVEPADVPPSPFAMTNETALVVSGAIGTLWCIAWAARAVRLAL